MEDKHVLIKGSTSLSQKLDLIPITMPLNVVNSGGPLFNSNNEFVGMVLFGKYAVGYYELERSKMYDYAIPVP
jgi:S1-C subfamily serine protease